MREIPSSSHLRHRWDRVAERWWLAQGPAGDTYRREIIFPFIDSLVPDYSTERIVDVGCGTGAFARHAARRGAEVVGLDYSHEMLTWADQSGAANGVRFELWDIQTPHSGLKSWASTVVSLFTFQDTLDLRASMHACAQMLSRNGGMIIVFEDWRRALEVDGEHVTTNRRWLGSRDERPIRQWIDWGTPKLANVAEQDAALYSSDRPLETLTTIWTKDDYETAAFEAGLEVRRPAQLIGAPSGSRDAVVREYAKRPMFFGLEVRSG
jgi:SAM-dependent methyltransferase